MIENCSSSSISQLNPNLNFHLDFLDLDQGFLEQMFDETTFVLEQSQQQQQQQQYQQEQEQEQQLTHTVVDAAAVAAAAAAALPVFSESESELDDNDDDDDEEVDYDEDDECASIRDQNGLGNTVCCSCPAVVSADKTGKTTVSLLFKSCIFYYNYVVLFY